jgi:hypothetical protein
MSTTEGRADVTIVIVNHGHGHVEAIPGHAVVRRDQHQTIAWENHTNGRLRLAFARSDLFEGDEGPVFDLEPDGHPKVLTLHKDLEKLGPVPYCAFWTRPDHSIALVEGGSHPMMIIL